jgi:hypothetical protein
VPSRDALAAFGAGRRETAALRDFDPANVRYGSKADMKPTRVMSALPPNVLQNSR